MMDIAEEMKPLVSSDEESTTNDDSSFQEETPTEYFHDDYVETNKWDDEDPNCLSIEELDFLIDLLRLTAKRGAYEIDEFSHVSYINEKLKKIRKAKQ